VPNNEKLGKNGMKGSVYVFLAAQQNLIFTYVFLQFLYQNINNLFSYLSTNTYKTTTIE